MWYMSIPRMGIVAQSYSTKSAANGNPPYQCGCGRKVTLCRIKYAVPLVITNISRRYPLGRLWRGVWSIPHDGIRYLAKRTSNDFYPIAKLLICRG